MSESSDTEPEQSSRAEEPSLRFVVGGLLICVSVHERLRNRFLENKIHILNHTSKILCGKTLMYACTKLIPIDVHATEISFQNQSFMILPVKDDNTEQYGRRHSHTQCNCTMSDCAIVCKHITNN